MRILVCGGRDYYKYSRVEDTLDKLLNQVWSEDEDQNITIIQGGAAGADFLAKVFVLDGLSWLVDSEVLLEEYPADWKTYGKAAGAIRNQQMLDEGKPNLVVAFPGGRGTQDMINRAKKANIEVIEVEDK